MHKAWLALVLIGFLLTGYGLFTYRNVYLMCKNDNFMQQDGDRQPYVDASPYFQVYVKGRLLQELVREERIYFRTDEEPQPISDSDLAFRVNRINENVRQPLMQASFCAAAGVVFMLFRLLSKVFETKLPA